MTQHTTDGSSEEIPYGYCHCGCGQKTNLAPCTDSRRGWKAGEPLFYLRGHRWHITGQLKEPNPSGLCMCGCGQKTRIARVTDQGRGWVRGKPIQYVDGHQKRKEPAPTQPTLCACGCGQPVTLNAAPSIRRRYISGHNNRQSVTKRFWERVDKGGPDDCWNWTASVGTHGYGTLSVDGHPRTTHRISWEIANGQIPDGLHVLHHCDNKLCCNPSHLFLGTNLDNIQDMVTKGRQAKGADKPDQKGENSPTAVLATEQVLEIRRRYDAGERQVDIARDFAVSKGHISNLCRRVNWKHV